MHEWTNDFEWKFTISKEHENYEVDGVEHSVIVDAPLWYDGVEHDFIPVFTCQDLRTRQLVINFLTVFSKEAIFVIINKFNYCRLSPDLTN